MSNMRRLIESMDKISEAGPTTGAAQAPGVLDTAWSTIKAMPATAVQNVKSTWATAKEVPGNIRRLASDPVQYIKDLPAPSPEQMATGWAGGAMKGGKVPGIGTASPKPPGAQAFDVMQKQLVKPDPGAQAFGAMQKQLATTPAASAKKATDTTPADLQKLSNIPGTRTAEPGGRIEPKFDVDEEKKAPSTEFPGYWKGKDPASLARQRMVGGESIIPSLVKHAKEKTLEWQLEEAYQQFKEAGEYTGIDPIVRQRMGMQAATQDEIRASLDKNPPGVQTSTGQAVTTGSGAPVRSGGQVAVAKAADAASPDRPQSVARTPAAPSQRAVPAVPAATAAEPAVAPAAPTQRAVTPAAPAAQSFGQAFAAARAAQQKASPGSPGAGQFNWTNPRTGKTATYHTGVKSEIPAAAKPAAPTRAYDPTAGEARDKAAQAAADAIDPGAPGWKLPPEPAATPATPAPAATPKVKLSFGQPGYNVLPGLTNTVEKRSDGKWYYQGSKQPLPPNVARNVETKFTSGAPAAKATPQVNRTPLTRQQLDVINANDRAAARAAGAQKNEAVNKLAEQFAAFMEEQDQYSGKYRAKPAGRRTKQVKEYENAQSQDSQVTSPPAPDATASSRAFTADKELQNMNAQRTLEADAGAQDPNAQRTSPPSPAAVAKTAAPPAPAAPDVSVATAKSTMAGLKPALGPGVDTNAAATGVTKANLGQPLNPAEQQAVSAITPLVMKAATIPSAAPQLRSALTNAGTMARATAAKQGKM